MLEIRSETPPVLMTVDGRWWWESIITVNGEQVRFLASAGDGLFSIDQVLRKQIAPAVKAGRAPVDHLDV